MLLSESPCLFEHALQGPLPYFSKNKHKQKQKPNKNKNKRNKPQTILLLKVLQIKAYSHYPDPTTIQFNELL